MQCGFRAAAGEPRAQLDCLLQPQNAEPIMGGTLVADGGTSTVSGDLSGAAEVGLELGTGDSAGKDGETAGAAAGNEGLTAELGRKN